MSYNVQYVSKAMTKKGKLGYNYTTTVHNPT